MRVRSSNSWGHRFSQKLLHILSQEGPDLGHNLGEREPVTEEPSPPSEDRLLQKAALREHGGRGWARPEWAEDGKRKGPTRHLGGIKTKTALTLFSHSAFSTSGKLTWRGETEH